MSNGARASLSLMTTSRLPINVISTNDVNQFYEKNLEKNQLGVNILFFSTYIKNKLNFFQRFLKIVSMVIFKIHLNFMDQRLKSLELVKKRLLEILFYHLQVCIFLSMRLTLDIKMYSEIDLLVDFFWKHDHIQYYLFLSLI